MKSTWREIREKYGKISASELARKYGVSRQAISQFELGQCTSAKLQVIYLKMRNNKVDRFNIEYIIENKLKGIEPRVKENKETNK